ncbi:TPA: hypothetical protein ACFP4Y_002303, partial [Neisseria bacilliformis]
MSPQGDARVPRRITENRFFQTASVAKVGGVAQAMHAACAMPRIRTFPATPNRVQDCATHPTPTTKPRFSDG